MNSGNRKRTLYRYFAIVIAVITLTVGGLAFADWNSSLPKDYQASFVGRSSCVDCHQQQAALFKGSHHDLAMDIATDETVLADFNNQSLEHFGITSRFFRRDGKYFVNTEGADGQMHDFEVKYVFGVTPLQQFMVEVSRGDDLKPNELGRVQVLRLSWDTKKKQWFYLRPPDVLEKLEPGDPLHWTGITQCWNTTCAECHSTDYHKNFDVDSGQYHTTFSEIDVSCEACHGPASAHVEIASNRWFFWDRNHGYGLENLKTGKNERQVNMCAQCHSRRRQIAPGFTAECNFSDYFVYSWLEDPLYHADGQIKDEVYVFGSFVQSKMYHSDIRCTDCHDPHSTRLKYEGNRVCTSCHQHPAAKYDSPAHHNHLAGSTGAQCVECHMPTTTYMMVDPRRDHSLRIPRPDLSVKLGTPNACTACHIEKTKLDVKDRELLDQYADWLLAAADGNERIKNELATIDQWAADAVNKWYGREETATPVTPEFSADYSSILIDSREQEGQGAASQALLDLARDSRRPVIVRGTALFEASRFQDESSFDAALKMLSNRDSQLVFAATGRLETEIYRTIDELSYSPNNLDLKEKLRQLFKQTGELLSHKSRLVRNEVARIYCAFPAEIRRTATVSAQDAFKTAFDGLIESLMVSRERAMSHAAIGTMYEQLGDIKRAERSFKTAMKVEPDTIGIRTRIAAMLDLRARQSAQRAQAASSNNLPDEAARQQGYVTQLISQAEKLRKDEHELLGVHLERFGDLANAPLELQYAMSWYLQKDLQKTELHLNKALEADPNDANAVLFGVLLFQKLEKWSEAEKLSAHLIELSPDHAGHQRLHQAILRRQPAN